MPEQRNIIIAIALSVAVLLAWSLIFPSRQTRPHPAPQTQTAPVPAAPSTATATLLTRDQAIAASSAQRVAINAPRVCGSISLTGARVDDLQLADYFDRPRKNPKAAVACNANSVDASGAVDPHVILLSPRGTKEAYYAEFGWAAAAGSAVELPGPDTLWTLENGSELNKDAPVTLRWTDPQGVTFRLTYAIDDNYMFTVTQEAVNLSGAKVALTPYGRIVRQLIPVGQTYWVQHEGFIGYVDDLRERTWKAILKSGSESWHATGGWLGITDKYWLTALAPPQQEPFDAQNTLEPLPAGNGTTATFQLAARDIAPGATARIENRFFAGAREVQVVNHYDNSLGIKKFDLAIDWGKVLWVLTKPIYFLLHFFSTVLGDLNVPGKFAISILLVTVVVKLLFFPLANRSFTTMAKMKKLQPLMKDMQERYKDDRVELQKQMMTLYQKEKVNPVSGCLPMFIQIPVFFSLYKVIFTTIDMRHQPFFGWIHDLSSRDPTQLINLFGIFHFHLPDPAAAGIFGIFISALTVGIWPILMGFVMFLQTALNPAPPDPTQKIVFAMMPVLFTVMLASFPAGLVIYYTWNNLLSITQQYVIMRRLGTPIDLAKSLGLKRIGRLFGGFKGGSPPQREGGTGS